MNDLAHINSFDPLGTVLLSLLCKSLIALHDFNSGLPSLAHRKLASVSPWNAYTKTFSSANGNPFVSRLFVILIYDILHHITYLILCFKED